METWSAIRSLKEVRKWVLSPHCTNKALKALFPIQLATEEAESDEGNEKEELSEENPDWPDLDSK